MKYKQKYKAMPIDKNWLDPKKIHFFQEIIEKSYQDKKNINNKIKICILDEIGKCNYDYEINENLIVSSLEYYNKIL